MTKKDVVYSLTSVENTLLHMPKYNGYQGGYGVHKNKKVYDRKRDKKIPDSREW